MHPCRNLGEDPLRFCRNLQRLAGAARRPRLGDRSGGGIHFPAASVRLLGLRQRRPGLARTLAASRGQIRQSKPLSVVPWSLGPTPVNEATATAHRNRHVARGRDQHPSINGAKGTLRRPIRSPKRAI